MLILYVEQCRLGIFGRWTTAARTLQLATNVKIEVLDDEVGVVQQYMPSRSSTVTSNENGFQSPKMVVKTYLLYLRAIHAFSCMQISKLSVLPTT